VISVEICSLPPSVGDSLLKVVSDHYEGKRVIVSFVLVLDCVCSFLMVGFFVAFFMLFCKSTTHQKAQKRQKQDDQSDDDEEEGVDYVTAVSELFVANGLPAPIPQEPASPVQRPRLLHHSPPPQNHAWPGAVPPIDLCSPRSPGQSEDESPPEEAEGYEQDDNMAGDESDARDARALEAPNLGDSPDQNFEVRNHGDSPDQNSDARNVRSPATPSRSLSPNPTRSRSRSRSRSLSPNGGRGRRSRSLSLSRSPSRSLTPPGL
jgi:hypothetical protein